MRRLRLTDGTSLHRRAAHYHATTLVVNGGDVHMQLHAEMAPRITHLKDKRREVDEARDASVANHAREDHQEIVFENLLRDIDADLGKLDRADPILNARATVFPHGYGAVIEPEGDAQLVGVPALRTRLEKFASYPVIGEHLIRFDATVAALEAAVDATNAGEALVDKLFAEELDARRAIREQLESAYGRLRAYYKATPAKAEKFFLREGARRPPPQG